MGVSTRLRYEVLRRDGFTCRYCGSSAPEVKLEVDHVVPAALGGTDEPSNLTTACEDCNAGKSSATPDQQTVDDVNADALRWSRAMQEAAVIQRARRDELDDIIVGVYEAWRPYYLPRGWQASVEQLIAAGADVDLIHEGIHIALTARDVYSRWSYFCGVVWRRINERQEIARELLDRREDGA